MWELIRSVLERLGRGGRPARPRPAPPSDAASWAGCTNPAEMLGVVGDRLGERELRLWACGMARSNAAVFAPPPGAEVPPAARASRQAVEVVERLLEGGTGPSWAALAQTLRDFDPDPLPGNPHCHPDIGWGYSWAAAAAAEPDHLVRFLSRLVESVAVAAMHTPEVIAGLPPPLQSAMRQYSERSAATGASAADLLRCIAGDPFRPAAFDARWRTPDAVALARAAHDGRAFDGMPVLADALMDAGCTDERVLAHLRDPGPHARGCWVLDAVLGLRGSSPEPEPR
jgi:hypothetical protein